MEKYLRKIYRGKKTLITGHTGFKGAWLSLWLSELGAEIIGYSLEPPTDPNLFESINLEEKIKHHTGDVTDKKHLFSVFEKYKPHFVFHLAAQPLVRLSYKEPTLTYETNVMGTVNVLEAVRKTKNVESCVIITSDKCYENKEWIYGYRETDPVGGYDPYSSTKGCAEIAVAAYRNSFFNPKDINKLHNVALSSTRAGNVIGGGDWGEDRIVPDCVRALSNNKEIAIRNPQATRPWQYVLEPLSGYLLLGAKSYENKTDYSSAWNFGPDDSSILTVKELLHLMLEQWGSGTYVLDNSINPHEADSLKLDSSKARSLLGWKPLYTINEAVEKTVEWYKNFYNGVGEEKLSGLMVDGINNYMARMGGK